MASPASMVVLIPNRGIEVKARQRLKDPSHFDSLLEELMKRVQDSVGTNGEVLPISDCDLSQNHVTTEQLDALFNTLVTLGSRVVRYRLFGCPTLNDEALGYLAQHFRTNLTSETAPSELHLSDCAITTEGFNMFMAVIEETDLYPCVNPSNGKTMPLYLRMENNYIADEAIQEKVNAGVIRKFVKSASNKMPYAADGVCKIDLVVRSDGAGFQQKKGDPPPPEAAPPPKPVFDKGSEADKWANNQWGQKGGAFGAGGAWQNSNARQSPWNTGRPAATAYPALPYQRQPMQGGGARPGVIPRYQGGNQRTPFGAGGVSSVYQQRAMDRSRTPQQRNAVGMNMSVPVPPGKPKKEEPLPHPWEEHFSDEYQIPYFWNAETGDSLWERPKK